MSAVQLLANFDRLAEAPGAVPRLRRFILDLAVRGRLVEQDARDPTSFKDSVIVGNLRAAELPFDVPDAWIWKAVREVAEARLGKMLDKAKNKGTLRRYLRNVNVRWFNFNLADVSEMRFEDGELEEFALRRGDVLICEGGEPGRAAVWDERESDIYFQKAIHRVRVSQSVNPHFFALVLRQAANSGRLVTYFTGVGIKHFTGQGLASFRLPVPPLAEQHRIVAKVDELMALCDQFEAAQQERERRRDRLASASLQRLNQPVDANPATDQAEAAEARQQAQREQQKDHAHFYLQNLNRLTTRPEHIKAMRENIRSLAITGKLVSQVPIEAPAKAFLDDVQAERANLIKAGEIAPAKPLQPIVSASSPFPSPVGWEWVRFGALINHSDAGFSPKTEGFPRAGNHWGVVKVSAVSWNQFKPDENKQLLDEVVPPQIAHIQAGDFLISRANTRELVAKCVIVDRKPEKLILSDKTVRLRLATLGSPHFWCLVNNHAAYAREYYATQASGTSDSMKNVSRPIIYNLLMPIPPLAEQHRIVAKVDELMALCDQLEAQLTQGQTESRRLLEAVLDAAIA